LCYRSGTFIIGSKSELELKIGLINSGEPAYVASVNITIPSPVELARGHMDCEETTLLHDLQLNCNFGNPLRTGNPVRSFWYGRVCKGNLETAMHIHFYLYYTITEWRLWWLMYKVPHDWILGSVTSKCPLKFIVKSEGHEFKLFFLYFCLIFFFKLCVSCQHNLSILCIISRTQHFSHFLCLTVCCR
jgi:hypothetical protein